MLARQSLIASTKRAYIYATQSVRHFSSADNDNKSSVPEGAGEWGVKYNDECLKFEKEWEEMANKVETEQSVYLKNELSQLQ